MKVSEAKLICDNATKCDVNSLTSNDVIRLEQSFGVCVDLELTVKAMISGTKKVSEVVAVELIKSTELVKTIIALRNNKSVPKEQTLITVLARVMLGRLQNHGDCYEIDYDKFKIEFILDESTKPDYDWKGIKEAAGLKVYSEVVNAELAKCFKAANSQGNPSGADQAMQEGKLDYKYKKDTPVTDVKIKFNWKEKGEK